MVTSSLIAPAVLTLVLNLAIPAYASDQTIVKAELWNKPDGSQGITLSTDHVKAGKVQFQMKNVSTNEDHELLLAKTDLAPADFPTDASGVRIDEHKFKGLKELGDLHKGESLNATLTLKAGKYVLFCNRPGHFTAGMHTDIMVEP